MNRVLVVAAHPDDEILGVGGTICNHIDSGDCVKIIILGEGQTSRFVHRENAPSELVKELHENTYAAIKELGCKDVQFADFPDNRFDIIDLLDIVKYVEKIVDDYHPNIIYTHHGGDLNVDHQQTYKAVLTATRPIKGNHIVSDIYSFETLSSTEWNFQYKEPFLPNVFVDVTKNFEKKVRAMQCYTSELRDFPHPRSIKGLEVYAMKWGSVVGNDFAEAFQLVRSVK